ncbi:MAG: MATE family efflux transporter [Candidatus Amulumruptor caecigallinarius]|nr:MATE family efflux transporter [Candidatus Amulumruptor caecigallinarius]MCM1396897.1 MATE family efflux transporter [Candidatus Amulumruptor caecigallinarius]MCM1454159.1 MATE family efflux transporter [bacterium]
MNKVNRDILRIAVPSVITNVTTPLLGLIDVAITGHMGNPAYLAAIAVGSMVLNMVYWLMGFLRMSASGLTAQAWGRGDLHAQALLLVRELLLAAGIGVLIIALSPIYGDKLIAFVDPAQATEGLTRQYVSILILGAPAVLSTYALTGWFLGRQNSRIAMWTSFVINITNILVSLLLVFGLGWKIKGVATGTLVAQWTGALMLLIVAMRSGLPHISLREATRTRDLGALVKVNTAVFLRTLCLVAVTVWFTRTGAAQGSVMLAANAMLMQLFMLFSYMMDGVAYAGEAIVGRDVGARDMAGLRRSVAGLLKWSGLLALLFTVAYIIGGEWLLGILSDEHQVVLTAREYEGWAFIVPLAGFAAMTWDGVMIGATLNRLMLASMGVAAAVFFVTYALAYPPMGNHGLWLAFVAYLFTRGVVQSAMWPGVKRRLAASFAVAAPLPTTSSSVSSSPLKTESSNR